MPGGAVEDVPVCLVLGTASVVAIEKKKEKKTVCSVGGGPRGEELVEMHSKQ